MKVYIEYMIKNNDNTVIQCTVVDYDNFQLSDLTEDSTGYTAVIKMPSGRIARHHSASLDYEGDALKRIKRMLKVWDEG